MSAPLSRRVMDGPDVEALIAEHVAAGANADTRQAMARLAVKHSLLTPAGRAVWERELCAS